MDFSQIRHPYPSRRSVTYGRRGMVATSQTLAAQAGLAMLKQGGNAADAIIATAIAMQVGRLEAGEPLINVVDPARGY